jgi:tetratricopeptide (TPR) repeat protein
MLLYSVHIVFFFLSVEDADAYALRGDAKKYIKDTIGCLKDYDSSILLNPNDYNTRINRGRMLWALDSMEQSQKDINYAVMLDSTKFDGVYYKSITHYFMKQDDSALKYFTKSITLDSTDDRPWYYRSKLYYDKDEYTIALKDINEAIKLNNKDAYYYISRALIYIYNENEYDDDLAEDDLYTALKMGSKEAQELLDEYFSDEDN